MLIYWIVFLIILYIAIFVKDKKKAFYIAAIILMLLGATRGDTVGRDMAGGYSEEFKTIHADPASWGQTMYQFEVGFAWLMGSFKDYVSNNRMYFFHLLFFITFLFYCKIIKRYSQNGALTLFFMMGCAYYFSLYNTMRQQFCFSIICLFLPLIIEKNKYLIFTLCTIITAFLFHKSQIILLLAIPIIKYYDTKYFSHKVLVISLVVSSLIGLFGIPHVVNFLGKYAFIFANDNSNYAGYLVYTDNIGNYSTVSNVMNTLFAIYIVYTHRYKKDLFLIFYVLGVVLLNVLTPVSWIFMRIAFTFMYFRIFTYTKLWYEIPDKNERYLYRFIVLLYIFIMFNNRLINDNNMDVVPYVNYYLSLI